MKDVYEKNGIPDNAPSPETVQVPGPGNEQDDDRFRRGVHIAAFLSALLILLGLAGMWLKSKEVPISATITAVGPVTSRTARNRRHGSTRTITTAPLTVRFEDGGETREEIITFRLRSVWIVPKPGQTAQVTKNPFGVYVASPDSDLESVSFVLIILGGLVLVISLIMLRSMASAEREKLLRSAEIAREGPKPPIARSAQVTDRVTLQPNGLYSWYGNMDNTYYRNEQYKGLKLMAGILLTIMAVLAVALQSLEYMLLVAGIFGFVFLLTLLIINLTVRGEGVTRELYTMCDEWIKAGSGKSSSFFTFSKARQVTFLPRYVELRGRVKTLRVYVPAEDMPFVHDYIRSRLLPGTDIAEP